MPSFDYFSTFDESISVLGDLCEQGFRIFACPAPYDEPHAPSFDEINDELVEILKISPAFYFAGTFSRFPVQFLKLDSGPSEGKYVVDLAGEGPLLQSLLGRVNEIEGVPTLLPGTVSYQDEYRNPENNEWAKASSDVKTAYRKLVSTIKKRCPLNRTITNRKIFIGPDALALLERGKAQISCL